MRKKSYTSVDEYIRASPKHTQRKLRELRLLIRKTAPEAQERIRYQMPTAYLNGNLVHFAAYEKHIGFYPSPGAISRFKADLSRYKSSKGAVQFPIEEPLPTGLITRIVKYRVGENRKK